MKKNIFNTIFFTEILQGLGITLRHFFTKPVTKMYPFKTPVIYPRFRGIHYMKCNENGEPRCVGCYLCEKVCPSECISIDTDCGPNGERLVKKYTIDLSRCIYCGFCEEVCPVDAIHMGKSYDLVKTDRSKYLVNMNFLVSNFKKMR